MDHPSDRFRGCLEAAPLRHFLGLVCALQEPPGAVTNLLGVSGKAARAACMLASLLLMTAVACAGSSGGSTRPTSDPSPSFAPTLGPAAATRGLSGVGIKITFGSPSDSQFTVPMRNIECQMTGGAARCDVSKHAWVLPPRPRRCPTHGHWRAAVEVDFSGRAHLGACSSYPLIGGPILGYGRGIDYGATRCVVAPDGVRCVNRHSRHGFWVNPHHVTTY